MRNDEKKVPEGVLSSIRRVVCGRKKGRTDATIIELSHLAEGEDSPSFKGPFEGSREISGEGGPEKGNDIFRVTVEETCMGEALAPEVVKGTREVIDSFVRTLKEEEGGGEREGEEEKPLNDGKLCGTVEDFLKELIDPHVREWLNKNLPAIVSKHVDKYLRIVLLQHENKD